MTKGQETQCGERGTRRGDEESQEAQSKEGEIYGGGGGEEGEGEGTNAVAMETRAPAIGEPLQPR